MDLNPSQIKVRIFWKIMRCMILCLLLLSSFSGYSQATYRWIGPNNGIWGTSTNWSPTRSSILTTDILVFDTGTSLTILDVPSQTIGKIQITNNSTITLKPQTTGNRIITVSADASDAILVNSGSKLIILGRDGTLPRTLTLRSSSTVASNATINGIVEVGIDNGNVAASGTFQRRAPAIFNFNAGSHYIHNRNAGTVPTSVWSQNSIMEITGVTNTMPTGLGQTFGTVILNNSENTVNGNFGPVRITGDLTVQNGGLGEFRQTSSYIIDGNFNLINGNYTVVNSTTSRTLTVAGNFTQSGGTLNMTISSGIGTLNVAGNFTQTAGIITETSTGSGTINLNGGGPQQIFTSGGTVSNTINWGISANSFVQTNSPSTTFGGGGSFTINAGAILGIRASDGLATTGATGHVRSTGTRTFNPTATYIFNGSGDQSSSPNFPATASTIRIENTGVGGNNTVTFNRNVTLSGDLLVSQGNLDLDTFTLSRGSTGGTFSLGGGLRLTVGGANNFPANYGTYSIPCTSIVEYDGALDQTIAGQNYGELILNGSGTKTFQSGISSICGNFSILGSAIAQGVNGFSIGGNVSIGSGTTFIPGAFTYQVGGNWTNSGTFSAAGSTIDFNGITAASIGASNFENITFSGTGTKTAIGSLSIAGNVSITGNFTAGAFMHTVGGNWSKPGTFIATGSTINFNGANSGNIGASNFNNLTFSGTGVKTATGSLNCTGNISITNNFSAGSFSHSLTGNWTSSSTSFTPGTSNILFNGVATQTIAASGNSFYNLTLDNSAGLTASGPLTLSNQLVLDAGSFAAGTNLTMGAGSRITRRGTGTSTGMNGTIQGSNAYDVIFEGGSKSTSSEISGAGLRDVTLAMNASSVLTAASNLSLSRLLTIPSGNTLVMGTFPLSRAGMTTSGTGTLITNNTSINPIPGGVNWSFLVRYGNPTGSQKVVFGTYANLDLAGTSGTVTFAQTSEGLISISSGALTLTGTQTYTLTGSTVVFNASTAQNIPGITFNNITLGGAGDKTLSNGTIINGTFSIGGAAVAKLGNTNRTVGTLLLNNVIQSTGSYGSTASAATNQLSQFFGTTGTGVIDVTSICIDGEWLGTTSSNWFDPTNWCGGIPGINTDVLIPATAPNQPIIGANGANAKNINIEAGASLTISGTFTLNVSGNWTNLGTFVPGTSNVVFSGSEDGLIGASNFYQVTFSGTGIKSASGNLTVGNNFTISNGATFEGGTYTHTLGANFSNSGTFEAESSTFKFNAGTSNISGSSSSQFYILEVNGGANLTLSSPTQFSNSLNLIWGTLNAGTQLSPLSETIISRGGTVASPTSFTGTLQGGNSYDLVYSGQSKTTGAETTGAGLRNLTLGLNSSQTLTASSSIAPSGVLTIPSENTLAMSTFALSNASMTTSGTGLLTTQNTSANPLPSGKTWSFPVTYSAVSGGQKIVYGVYNGLSVSNTSGTNTLAPVSDGGEIEIASGNFTASGSYISTNSTVRFNGTGNQTVPAITFNNLILEGSGNKSFSGTTTVSNILTIGGSAILRLGSVNSTANFLVLGIAGQPSGTFGSTASSASFRLSSSFGTVDLGVLTVLGSNCTPGIWLGYADTNWNNAANWCSGIPTSTTDVVILGTAPNQPIIGSTGGITRNLTIQTGASLAFSGAFNLDMHGNWVNNGTFIPNLGRITVKGSGNQSFGGTSSTTVYRLNLEKLSAEQFTLNSNLTISNTLSLTSGTFIASTRLTMGANSQVIRGGTTGATTTFTGAIQGTNPYDVTYEGNGKTTGAEISGVGLRNITLNLISANELTASTAITHTGSLNIPSGRSLNLATFVLSNGSLSTTGTGLLKTASTANPPLPRGVNWSFEVNYTSTSGGQRVVFGTYNTLKTLNTSGTTTLDPLSAGGEIEIASGNFTTSGSITATGSKVVFSDSGIQTLPAITYSDLVLQGSGDKVFSGVSSITGTLSITGAAVAKLLNVNHTAANLSLGSIGQPNGSFGSSASSATYKVTQYFGTTGTGQLTVSTSTCSAGLWLGYISTAWNTATNWCGGVPNSTSAVTISSAAPNQPLISAGNVSIFSLDIESGATLTMSSGRNLTLEENWNNDGTFIPGNGKVIFASNSDDQAITGSGINNFFNLEINKSAGLELLMDAPSTLANKLTLLSGDFYSQSNLTVLANSSIDVTAGVFYGSIQGSNPYDITYLGASKTSASEVSGLGLRNISLSLSASATLTAGTSIAMSGTLSIPSGLTLAMGGNALSGNLTPSGTGLLTSSNTSASPLPGGKNWTFGVTYSSNTGGQKVVYGTYNGLAVSNNSGVTNFAPETDGAITIATGNLTLTGAGTKNASTSRFRFTASGDQTIPALTFKNLELAGSGDKTFGGSLTVVEELSISGTAVARLLNANHNSNTVTLGATVQPSGTYGSTASSAQYKLNTYFGTSGTGILTVATGLCTAGTWFGVTSTDWNTASNWCGGIPALTTNVVIPAATPFSPSIGLAGGKAQNLTINSGATLTISGAHLLEVAGNWTNNGTFNPGTTSTVEFKSSAASTINGGSFANISFTGSGTKTINNTLSISGNITPVSAPVVLSNPFSMTLNSGMTMEILSSGSVNTAGASSKLILQPNAIYVNRSTSNPRIEVKQLFTGEKGWRMIGSPITTTYATLTSGFETQGFAGSTNPTLQPNLLWWDETDKGTSLQGWRQPSSLGATAPAGRGHYFYIFNGAAKPSPSLGNYTDLLPITMATLGTEVNLASGNFDFGITFTPRPSNLQTQTESVIEVNQADQGFNLIANPTASYLDWDATSGWIKTNIDQSIYVWDPASSSFLTWNGTIGSLGNGRIAPFQGFWVRSNASSPSLQLSGNGAKTLNSKSFFGRELQEVSPHFHLRLSGESLSAETYISFGGDGKPGMDPKDAYQLESLAENWLLLYTYGSTQTKTPLVINHQAPLDENEKVIPLHLAASKGGKPVRGSYLMDWTLPENLDPSITVLLMDHISQRAINMRDQSAYSFTFEAPQVPNARKNGTFDPLNPPQAVIFESPYETGIVSANARTESSSPKRPFTIFISGKIESDIGYLPQIPKLFNPAPNPFTDQTKIKFYLPGPALAKIQIINLLGQVVGEFPLQDYAAGVHELDWTPKTMELAPGMYVIQFSTGTFQLSQKLIKN